jgi:uncharacterized protein (TIGR00251 family)
MRIRVFPNSRQPGIEQLPDGLLKVRVSAPPQEGRANEEVIEALAGHFHVPKSHIRILHGQATRDKLVEVPDAAIPNDKCQSPNQGTNDQGGRSKT